MGLITPYNKSVKLTVFTCYDILDNEDHDPCYGNNLRSRTAMRVKKNQEERFADRSF